MNNVVDRIKLYSEKVSLKERFNYDFEMETSIINASIIESIRKSDNIFEKNVILKELLKHQYQDDSDNTKLNFWVINNWGGIYGFKPTLKNINKIISFKKQLESTKLSK